MTVANNTPDIERLVEVVEGFLRLVKEVVDRAHVGERHGFAAPVACFAHQAQCFAVLFNRLTPRLARSFALKLCGDGVSTLGSHTCAICVRRSSQILEPYLV